MATDTIASHGEQAVQDSALPQLAFELDNQDAPNTIYITTDKKPLPQA